MPNIDIPMGDKKISQLLQSTDSETRTAAKVIILAETQPMAPGVPAPTTPQQAPVIRTVGDGRVAVWEYVANGGGAYIWHLMQGQNSTSGDWLWGVGLDSGSGGGMLLRIKNNGTGQKVEMVASATDTAVGIQIQHNNVNATGLKAEQFDGMGLLAHWISYDTGVKSMIRWTGRQGTAGEIQGNSGDLTWWKPIHARGTIHQRNNNTTVADDSTDHLYTDPMNVTFRKYSGSTNIFYPSRIRAAGTTTVFQMGNNSALNADDTASSFETVIGMGTGGTGAKKLAFFGTAPIVKQTLTYSRTGEHASTAALRTVLANLGLVTDSTVA